MTANYREFLSVALFHRQLACRRALWRCDLHNVDALAEACEVEGAGLLARHILMHQRLTLHRQHLNARVRNSFPQGFDRWCLRVGVPLLVR